MTDLKETLKRFTPLQWIILFIFVIYIIYPWENPEIISFLVNSPLGIVFILFVSIYIFIYCCPIIGCAFIISVYFLISRSSIFVPIVEIQKTTPTQIEKDIKLRNMNPMILPTLEEIIIEQRAPIGKSNIVEYISSSFKPTFDNANGVSLYR